MYIYCFINMAIKLLRRKMEKKKITGRNINNLRYAEDTT